MSQEEKDTQKETPKEILLRVPTELYEAIKKESDKIGVAPAAVCKMRLAEIFLPSTK